MAIQVGINGFGRIGRSVFRIISDRDNMEVVAINDLFDNEQLAYLLKYDTVMGVFDREVSAEKDAMTVGDHRVAMTEHRDPAPDPLEGSRCSGRDRIHRCLPRSGPAGKASGSGR